MNILQSNAIYTSSGIIDGYLILEGKKIIDIITDKDKLPKGTIIAYGKQRIIPGIIDIHTHGYRTFAARSFHVDEVIGLAKVLPSIGVTSTLPTVCGWCEQQLEMLETVAQAIQEQEQGCKLLGIHIEGSFFHPTRHNSTPLNELKEPSIALCEAFLRATKGTWKYLTLAPELPNAKEVIEWLCANDIIVGAGHTIATYKQFLEAKDWGIKTTVHTGNAMTQMDRREIGLMGGSLLDSEINCEINCDFIHLSKEMLEIMFRTKGNYTKFIMISDSDTVSGVEAGDYLVNGQRIRITDDKRMLLGDGTIAGSCRNILYGIKNLCEEMQIPLQDIIKMSALNPAQLLGINDRKGSIEVGKDADIVVLDEEYQVIDTYVEGNLAYHKGDELLINPRFDEDVPRIYSESI